MSTIKKSAPSLEARIRRKTLVSFAVFLMMIGLGWAAWLKIYHAAPAPGDPYIRAPFRTVLRANEAVFSGAFSPYNLTKTYTDNGHIKPLRLNGNIGMTAAPDDPSWRLKVARAPGDTLFITLDELKQLPKTDVIFDFKCIEGWDQVTHWGGVRLSDFIKHYHLDSAAAQTYMGLRTPDGGYFVGIDRESALHPQTILAYEMNGRPLPAKQGAPLRLIIPIKYGIKHLKQIGTMFFSNARPRDYWAELGYDYYSGL